MSVLPPNPSLVAIILLIKTKQGVKHIYHYPPQPGDSSRFPVLDEDEAGHSSESETGRATYSSSSESSDSSVEDEPDSDSDRDQTIKNRLAKTDSEGSRKPPEEVQDADIDESGSTSPEKNGNLGWRATKGKKELLGLPPGFASFLCPSSEMNRRRFEMKIDQLTFLGWPCFAKEDGSWSTKRKRKLSKEKDDVKSHAGLDSEHRMPVIEEIPGHSNQPKTTTEAIISDTEPGETQESDTGHETTDRDSDQVSETDTHVKVSAPPGTTKTTSVLHNGDTMSMFHVVFVMNPPPLEYQVRVDEMYNNVVKKFSRTLQREQARSDYVFKECQKLKSMKARHDPASSQVVRASRLAKAIATLYKAISGSLIAHIDLTPRRSIWLQIPIPTSIASLPGATEPQLPGVWLTTSTIIPMHDELSTTSRKLASNFALLLLTDIHTILSGISDSSPVRGPLEHYLSHSTPTKSFLQISEKASMSLEDITLLASHLIHWRQARVIPPLHKKDVYIMSPNADMRRLKDASNRFSKEFPLQPPLATILARLNSVNRPYNKSVIPHKEHKEAFMNILAWLMRGGWVTQIRTFAWVRVPGQVREIVRDLEERERGEMKRKNKRMIYKLRRSRTKEYATSEDDSNSITDEEETDEENHLMLSSTHSIARSTTSTPSTRSHNSASSTLTAVPINSHAHKTSSSYNNTPLPSILLSSPTRTSGLESRYLEYISSEIERSGGSDMREAWHRCLPFFDGEHALEQIPLREGWKRSYVEALRAGWVKDGWIREGRCW